MQIKTHQSSEVVAHFWDDFVGVNFKHNMLITLHWAWNLSQMIFDKAVG